MPSWWSLWESDEVTHSSSIPCVVGKKWGHTEVWQWLVYKRKVGSLSCTWAPVIASSKSTENSTHSKPVHVAFCGYKKLVEDFTMDLSLHTILLISATFYVFVEEGKPVPLSYQSLLCCGRGCIFVCTILTRHALNIFTKYIYTRVCVNIWPFKIKFLQNLIGQTSWSLILVLFKVICESGIVLSFFITHNGDNRVMMQLPSYHKW